MGARTHLDAPAGDNDTADGLSVHLESGINNPKVFRIAGSVGRSSLSDPLP